MATSNKQPTYYIPHGGGPCFYMDWTMGPADTWNKMAAWLGAIGSELKEPPRALLVISAHWEEKIPTVMTASAPPLYFDYYGFPPHTYELKWPAPGSPELAARVRDLLKAAGIESAENGERGLDHGVFVPLKLTFPDASIPVIQLSLRADLDPAEHLKIGKALAPLRDEGVLIIGSGMSYHNMRGFTPSGIAKGVIQPAALEHSKRFDTWMSEVVASAPEARNAALTGWKKAPSAIESHPREEHLIPLMVAAGAAGDDRGSAVFRDEVMKVVVSGVRFG
jgi:aromatic ring-opening dioxygenase catalytic subunit (LigB family)